MVVSGRVSPLAALSGMVFRLNDIQFHRLLSLAIAWTVARIAIL
jgi:hypothetical protein